MIDPRTGAIHIIPVDLNKDGHMDFVVLLAQDHDRDRLHQSRHGRFHVRSEGHLRRSASNWGSSGIQLVDLDKDGDLDVILTHGDTFDDGIVKPYHGIQWLENKGTIRSSSTNWRTCPGCIARLRRISTATAISTSWPARSSPAEPTWTKARFRARVARADNAWHVRQAHDRVWIPAPRHVGRRRHRR